MSNVFKKWYESRFHDEEAIILALMLAAGVALILLFSEILTPVIASLVVAFIMQGLVSQLARFNCPHLLSVVIAFILLVLIEAAIVFVLLTLVLNQMDNLVSELPKLITLVQDTLSKLPEKYPNAVTYEQITEWTELLNSEIAGFGQWVVSFSQSKIPNMINFLIYLILVPVLVFFFLKDKQLLLGWFVRLLPAKRPLLSQVWNEMNDQVANYFRGKVIEMFIVGGISFIVFVGFDLNYAALMAIAVGLSVIVPYVGAFIVTIPVAIVAYLQWGWGTDFIWLFIAYVTIQVLDGNLLVPLLFSEAVNLHPVAILLAILFFGGIWGLWGVFFAIPLATLIKAVINAWPTLQNDPN